MSASAKPLKPPRNGSSKRRRTMPVTNTNTNNLTLISRRNFLRASVTAAGGLLLALYLDSPSAAQEKGQPPSKPNPYPPDPFMEIRQNGKILIQLNRLDFGQGFR